MMRWIMLFALFTSAAIFGVGRGQPQSTIEQKIAESWQKLRMKSSTIEYRIEGTKILKKSGPKRTEAAKQSRFFSTRSEDIRLKSNATIKINMSTGHYRLERDFEEYKSSTKQTIAISSILTYDGKEKKAKQLPAHNPNGDVLTETSTQVTEQSNLPLLIRLVLPISGVVNLRADLVEKHGYIASYQCQELLDQFRIDRNTIDLFYQLSIPAKHELGTKTHYRIVQISRDNPYQVHKISELVEKQLIRETVYDYRGQIEKSCPGKITDSLYILEGEIDSVEQYNVVGVRFDIPVDTTIARQTGETLARVTNTNANKSGPSVDIERYRVSADGNLDAIQDKAVNYWHLLPLVTIVISILLILYTRYRRTK